MQYPLLLYGWLCEQARWSKSCVLISYPSGQDEPILLVRVLPLHSCNLGVIFLHYIINYSLLTKFVWSRWLDIVFFFSFLKAHKKTTWPISCHLDLMLVNNAYVYYKYVYLPYTDISSAASLLNQTSPPELSGATVPCKYSVGYQYI